jgi:hypothetical protein
MLMESICTSKTCHKKNITQVIHFNNIKMTRHKVYSSIVKAVNEKKLKEPFTINDFEKTCPGFANLTYKSFLHNNRKGNTSDHSELFIVIEPGKFKLIRPIKYNL